MTKYPSQRKYESDKCKSITIKFYPPNRHVYDWIKAQDNQTDYIRELVIADMLERGVYQDGGME